MSMHDGEADDLRMARELGLPPYQRRLADRIVSAFNHAVAQGRGDVAEPLRQALELCVRSGKDHRDGKLLQKAGEWQAFIARRDAYQRLRGAEPAPPTELRAALLAMRQAYQSWSAG